MCKLKISISPELQKVFNKIYAATRNKIAKDIYDIEVNYHDDNYFDHIDISKQNPFMLSYINKERIDRIKKDKTIIHKEQRQNWLTDEWFTHTWYEETWTQEDFYNPKMRYHCKPAKLIETLFPGKYTNVEKEKFTDLFKNEMRKENNIDNLVIEFFSGEDIRKKYHEKSYSKGYNDEGSQNGLINSCMKHDRCQEYLDIYCKNVAMVELAVLHEMDEVVARCICWYPDGKDKKDGRKWFDRIYAVNDTIKRDVQAELEKLGYFNISPKNCIPYEGSEKFTITLPHVEFDSYPYVDTLYYLNTTKKTLSNVYNGGEYELLFTDGAREEEEEEYDYTCERCGEGLHEDYAYVMRAGAHEDEIRCGSCSIYSDVYECRIAAEEAIYTDVDEYVPEDEVLTLHNGTTCWEDNDDITTSVEGYKFIPDADDEFIAYDGEWYHIDNEKIVEVDGEYYHIDSPEYEELLEKEEEE